jgi:hypothetical protein
MITNKETLKLLAEWLAIEHGATRLQYKDNREAAQELADYLYIIGYRLKKEDI